ncbi:primosomal protein N' [Lusitaniella coriacea LEGE 07157]|uniref:Replication restart protein PriA n=1 Tax=Lusitaniella coriacea LEGE 07157 TaxID=945747 RepID=A0A8J7DXR9_9CYAN|nr:primosomal protein N' [Lusitaniella coriacea]MBE9117397.1 primosomal protein N' [Lusitaniella coriacea LEGE 07157]
MDNSPSCLAVAEPTAPYQFHSSSGQERWVEVLTDCPSVEELFTYRVPPDLSLQPGDIVSIPFGAQITGGIVIRFLDSPPPGLDPQKIKDVEEAIAAQFFPSFYWQLLERVARHYYTPLIIAIRAALPPGLLRKSQRRIRLNRDALPSGAETFCSASAQAVLRLLQQQKAGDYSAQHIQRKIRGARQGLRELLKRGWVESYLQPPKRPRPKQQKAVTLVANTLPLDLTPRQREVIEVLRRKGGELWLSELCKSSNASSSAIETLERKGCVVIQYREILRLSSEGTVTEDSPKALTSAQAQALDCIRNLEGFSRVLLHGVTGSGKTEVYLQAIAPLLERGQSALVLVPEIGLTPQLTDRFRARFRDRVCVYHSALSPGERYDTWRQMLQGEPQVVIGTRSAIFVPLPNLGAIVLDEEHDSSFKQQQPTPTYHARTVAQWRAELEDCPLILGSATPSLESWVEIQQDPSTSCHYLSLPERIESRPLPPITIVDMRRELHQGNRSIFSDALQTALRTLKQQGRQGILFIPRRGYSTFVSCRSCGYVIECPDCDVSLSYHRVHEDATPLLRCHYCNHTQLHPPQCPECASPYFKFFGSGTQRVAQELAKAFPELRCIRFDSDTTRTKGAHRRLLERFAQGEADILLGTQMLTKGLDLAQVTLVGVVSADGLLHRSDYRATERAFQTLTQVVGRAGRGDDPGQAIIQTYTPEHPVIQAVYRHDYHTFTENTLKQRAEHNYPPYGRVILLRLSGLDEGEVQATAEIIAQACHNILPSGCEILGPAPASIMRVSRRYRWNILLKFPPSVGEKLPDLLQLRALCPQSISFALDVDPLNIE